MTSTILAAILWLLPAPSPKWNESPEDFRTRMAMIDHAIDLGTQDVEPPALRRELKIAIAVTFWGESRFAPLIHSGEKKGDGGKALCLGQLHQNKLTEDQWRGLVGLDLESTTRCAQITGQRLLSARRYCQSLDPKSTWTHGFVAYGTGRTCNPEESKWKNLFLDRGNKWTRLATGKAAAEIQDHFDD